MYVGVLCELQYVYIAKKCNCLAWINRSGSFVSIPWNDSCCEGATWKYFFIAKEKGMKREKERYSKTYRIIGMPDVGWQGKSGGAAVVYWFSCVSSGYWFILWPVSILGFTIHFTIHCCLPILYWNRYWAPCLQQTRSLPGSITHLRLAFKKQPPGFGLEVHAPKTPERRSTLLEDFF